MNHRLNISFFGPSLISAHWNGAAAFYRGLVRALAERGHRVTFYEPDAYDRQQHRDIPPPHWARVIVYPATDESTLETLERAEESDLIIKCSGVGVFDELLEAAVLELKNPETLVAFLDVDPFATLDRMRCDPEDCFRPLIPEYSFILTRGGGAPVVDAYLAAGAVECVPIHNALDSHTCFPAPPEQRFEGDLGFLGNCTPDAEAPIDEFFFQPAATLPARKFVLAGNGWQKKLMPPNVNYLGCLPLPEHNAFNGSPRAVLSIQNDTAARQGFSPPMRLFEAAGAGACVITNKWTGIELFLEPGREVLLAANGGEVAEHLEQLTPERAREIARACRARVLAEHTYAHRAAQLEKVMEGAVERITA
jgi:spore maturation protein CgeB